MIGTTIAHYQITSLLGKGGMGEVYRAHDPRTGRDVAIKILPASFASDNERLARFQREARTLASLSHKNIAVLYGVEEENGQPFLVMEVAEGADLSDRIAAGPIPLDECIELALQMAEAIEEAHEKGVVHRDLKPANVVVDADGLVKVLDFGLARAYEGGDVSGEDDLANSPTITAAMTQAGTVLGTAAYMSPEQARGRSIDRRSDLWAFGVILWEMLSGQRLFTGDTVSDTIASVLKTDPDWEQLPSATPHGVRRLLERCLERDVRNRLRDIGEARIRLQRWKTNPSSLDESFGTAELQLSPARTASWLPWAVSAVAVAVAIIMSLRGGEGAPPPPERLVMAIRLQDEENMADDGFAALTISPDGQYLLWNSATGVYLRRLSSLEERFIPAPSRVTSAGFSPDSHWIAYSHSGKLFRQSVTGGAAIEVCEVSAGRGLSWVDEQTIVMSIDYTGPLQLISVADGSLRPLTQLRDEERSHRWPSVVPGHDEVLFMSQLPGRDYEDSDIEAVSLADGSRRTIYRGGAFPRYSPTGHLIFARSGVLLATRYEPGSEAADALATPIVDGVRTFVGDQELHDGSAQYGFDDQGTLIYRTALTRTAAASKLGWLDLESGEIATFSESSSFSAPLISPDGSYVAMRRGVGSESQIVVLDLESGSERAITSDRGTKYMGQWDAESQFVYWTQANADASEFEIRRAPRDGSVPPEAIFSNPHSMFVEHIASDDRWLYLSYWIPAESYNTGRFALDSDDPTLEELLGGPGDQGLLRFSPDARFFIYMDGPVVHADYYVRRMPDTGARWLIAAGKSNLTEFYWSADGSGIFELNGESIASYPVEFSGDAISIGQPKYLHPTSWIMRGNEMDTSIHPDGERVLVLVPDQAPTPDSDSRIIWMTGWFDELQRMSDGN